MAGTVVDTYVQATFQADGTARARTSPQVYGARWRVERMHTSTTSSHDTELRVYLGSEDPNREMDSSYAANSDTSDTVIEVATTQALIFVWSGGDPGAIATCTITGKQLGR